MRTNAQRNNTILLVGGLLLVATCLISVVFLLYQSIINKVAIPEYSLSIFLSVATLIIGYLFGKNGGKD